MLFVGSIGALLMQLLSPADGAFQMCSFVLTLFMGQNGFTPVDGAVWMHLSDIFLLMGHF